jgi:hypothetical protein
VIVELNPVAIEDLLAVIVAVGGFETLIVIGAE